MPRIRNWKDLTFFRPSKDTRYKHIDALFTDTVDWELIETHWEDLLQVVLSVKAGVVSSALLLRKLGTYSRRNRLYQAFAELGRVIRTGFLLEYLSSAQLREQITASTNKVEAYHRFAKWLFFGGEGLLLEIHPDEQEKRLKYNHLLTNAVAIQNVIDLTRAVRALLAEGYPVKHEDLATLSPYQTRHIKRFGDYVFTVTTPERSTASWSHCYRGTNPPRTPPSPDTLWPIFTRISAARRLGRTARRHAQPHAACGRWGRPGSPRSWRAPSLHESGVVPLPIEGLSPQPKMCCPAFACLWRTCSPDPRAYSPGT